MSWVGYRTGKFCDCFVESACCCCYPRLTVQPSEEPEKQDPKVRSYFLTLRFFLFLNFLCYTSFYFFLYLCSVDFSFCWSPLHIFHPKNVYAFLWFLRPKRVCWSLLFKETVQRDFWALVFFHHSNQPGPMTNGLKCFRFWSSFRRVIQILVLDKLTPRSIILGAVKNKCYHRTYLQIRKM